MNSEKPKKKLYKRWWFWVLAIIVFLNLTRGLGELYPRVIVRSGGGMEPTLKEGYNVITVRFFTPERGDVVLLKDERGFARGLKRIVGMPGETVAIQDGRVMINGEPLSEPYAEGKTDVSWSHYATATLGGDEYYVLGDERMMMLQDSRILGPIPRSGIMSKSVSVIP
jgi:signal peptidase I